MEGMSPWGSLGSKCGEEERMGRPGHLTHVIED